MIANILLGIGTFVMGFGIMVIWGSRDVMGYIPPNAPIPFLIGAVVFLAGVVIKVVGSL